MSVSSSGMGAFATKIKGMDQVGGGGGVVQGLKLPSPSPCAAPAVCLTTHALTLDLLVLLRFFFFSLILSFFFSSSSLKLDSLRLRDFRIFTREPADSRSPCDGPATASGPFPDPNRDLRRAVPVRCSARLASVRDASPEDFCIPSTAGVAVPPLFFIPRTEEMARVPRSSQIPPSVACTPSDLEATSLSGSTGADPALMLRSPGRIPPVFDSSTSLATPVFLLCPLAVPALPPTVPSATPEVSLALPLANGRLSSSCTSLTSTENAPASVAAVAGAGGCFFPLLLAWCATDPSLKSFPRPRPFLPRSAFFFFFFAWTFTSQLVPAKMALVSVSWGLSFSSDSVNSSYRSLVLKKRRCFGSFSTRFVRNCLKICLKVQEASDRCLISLLRRRSELVTRRFLPVFVGEELLRDELRASAQETSA